MSALPASGPSGALPQGDYERFAVFLRARAGIELHQYKRRQMERRIRSFAERLGARTLDEYAALLDGDPDEMDALLDRITINVSQLFRNPEQWEHLGSSIIPELAGHPSGSIRAWSAGCSFGAEAFSLAALVSTVAPDVALQVRASDIDRRILAAAGRGEFSDTDARTAPAALLAAHFTRAIDGGWVASPSIRSAVSFHHEDLLATSPREGSFDLVLCRNVVIYFTPEARALVHESLARSLRAGGYLVIGSTERVATPLEELGLELASPFIYRKRT